MTYLHAILHQKIHLALALLIIIIIAVISAFAISVQSASLNFGGKISYYQRTCSAAWGTPNCPSSPCRCPHCGCVWAPCPLPAPKWQEIDYMPGSGNIKYICPATGYLFKGGPPMVGKSSLGTGLSPYNPLQIGNSLK